jgi:hypothetical protein
MENLLKKSGELLDHLLLHRIGESVPDAPG